MSRATGTESILVVEDDDVLRQLIADALELHGYHVRTAADGAEAKGILEAEPGGVELVITDLVMPRLGGVDLYKLTRESAGDAAFLFISGHAEGSTGEVPSGPLIGLLAKPCSIELLLSTARTLLDRREGGIALL